MKKCLEMTTQQLYDKNVKTRAQLLKDINEIREQAQRDAPIWEAHAKRTGRLDRSDTFGIGLFVGMALMALIGGCHLKFNIKSTTNAPTPTDSRLLDHGF